MGLLRCGDGRWVIVGATSRERWENYCITVDAVELLADEALYAAGGPVRAGRRDRRRRRAVARRANRRAGGRGVPGRGCRPAKCWTTPRRWRPAARARACWAPSTEDLLPGARLPGRPFRRRTRTRWQRRRRSGRTPRRPRRVAAGGGPGAAAAIELGDVRMIEFYDRLGGPAGRRCSPTSARRHQGRAPGQPRARHGAQPPRAGPGRGASWPRRGPRRGVPRRRSRGAPVEPHGRLEQDEPQQAQPLRRCQGTRRRRRPRPARRDADVVVHNYTPRGAAR